MSGCLFETGLQLTFFFFFSPTRSCVVMLKKHMDKTLNCNCVHFQIFVDAQSTHHLTLKECCFVSNCRLVGCLPHKSSARGPHTHIHTHAHTHTSEARARVCGQNHTIYEHLYGNHRSRVIIVLMKVDFFFMVSLQAFFFLHTTRPISQTDPKVFHFHKITHNEVQFK